MKHLCHGGAGDVCALLRKPAFGEIPSCVLGISHIHVRNNIHYTAVCLFRQTLVLAAVARLHMEYRYMKSLCRYCGEAGVCVAEYQKCVGLNITHQLI